MAYNLLKGKRGIIFGALNDMSIAWKVAEKAVEEGATITLSNTPVAVRMGDVSKLGEKLNAEVIPADATNVEDLEMVFRNQWKSSEERSISFSILSACHPTCARNVSMMTSTTICSTRRLTYQPYHSTR